MTCRSRFLLFGVAGAVLNPGPRVDARAIVRRRDGAVRIVPSLPFREEAAREDAMERLRLRWRLWGVKPSDVVVEEASLSMSLSIASRESSIAGFRGVMPRRTSAKSLISSRNSFSVRGWDENRADSYAERKLVTGTAGERIPSEVKWLI
jgi:hypothetical protein